ncbi:ATP/GTP-binding protein [Pseudonocardia sp. DSM 110487]|uniref:GTP-binding protein n=1 Tax=Pseudonocardia sp. DSM 110487 TaxID=2865833 RepID=UPI001C694F19|nr:ATP/GTP-binding protein [Pseudonocardia sp. DSM 110487]QYN40471.1 ATP/GTP-binding protein [Pseudonocardia sp. DSM 110487]
MAPIPLKIVVAGGFGVGKTTLVQTVSEIGPLSTEEPLTVASVGVDDLRAVPDKTTTTVALDFGRISVGDSLVLYLFGTPGQDRFWFMWDELARGAVGAVVLVDVRRIADSFAAVDYFESRDVPFVVAMNAFPGADRYRPEAVHDALRLRTDVPVVPMDARVRGSCLTTIVRLVEHALDRSNVVQFPRSVPFSR